MAFTKKTKQINVEGVELVITELSKRESKTVEACATEHDGLTKAFILAVRKPDGTPFFANADEVEDLPVHVMKEIGTVMKSFNDETNEVKN